jgi:hypothetical protein
MKKTSLSITLLTIVVLSLVLISKVGATGSATATISAVQSGSTNVSNWSIGPNPDPKGTTVQVDLYVSGASNVWSLKTDVTWNVSMLNLTSVIEGTFLKKNPTSSTLFVGGDSTTWEVNSTGAGSISGGISDTRLTDTVTTNTVGVLATLTFTVVGYGQANILLSGGILTDGSYATSTPSLNIATITVNNSTLSSGSSPSSAGSIDVFTDKDGIAGLSGGVYGPQSLVNTYGLVTYNNSSVANIEVSFNVQYPNGTLFTLETAATNSTGYANSDFRLPWLDNSDPESLFGNWSITAYAEVAQTLVNDTTTFVYNYIVDTNGIQLPVSIERQTTASINVTIQNMVDSPVWSTVEVTIYDETNVPIGSYLAYNNNATTGNTTVLVPITIPSWAVVGQATVYVDVLTNLPNASATPYCPEKVANFQITQ